MISVKKLLALFSPKKQFINLSYLYEQAIESVPTNKPAMLFAIEFLGKIPSIASYRYVLSDIQEGPFGKEIKYLTGK